MRQFTILLLFSSPIWAQNQCYYAAGRRAGSAIIPCGPSSSVSSCCQIGDLCLSDSSCWNPQHDVTYLYGCTDSTYTDPACPWKCGDDFGMLAASANNHLTIQANAPYVGLDYCSNTTENEWSCTHPPSNSESIQAFDPQGCYNDSIIAFAGPSVLQPILSLPTNIGGGTVWFSQVNPTSYSLDPNFTPTTTSMQATASVPTTVERVSSTTTTSEATSTSSSNSQTSTAPTATSSSSSGGLSTGAKVGIGVGIAGGIIGILTFIGAFFLYRRRKHMQSMQTAQKYAPNGLNDEDADLKDVKPTSELPGTIPDSSKSGHQPGLSTSSTVGEWGSPAPTYQKEPQPLKKEQNMIYELG